MTISIAPSFEQQTSFFEWEIRFFPIRKLLLRFLESLLKRYIDKLNNLLDQFYVEIQGSLVIVQDYSTADASRDLPYVRKCIRLLATYHGFLERSHYFESNEVRTKFGLVISALYDVEIELKKRSFASQPRTLAAEEVLNELSAKSRAAIQGALSR